MAMPAFLLIGTLSEMKVVGIMLNRLCSTEFQKNCYAVRQENFFKYKLKHNSNLTKFVNHLSLTACFMITPNIQFSFQASSSTAIILASFDKLKQVRETKVKQHHDIFRCKHLSLLPIPYQYLPLSPRHENNHFRSGEAERESKCLLLETIKFLLRHCFCCYCWRRGGRAAFLSASFTVGKADSEGNRMPTDGCWRSSFVARLSFYALP